MTRFDLGDAPALLRLSESVDWAHSLEDWQTALAAGVVFGHRVAEQIQSSTALHKYGTELASIGQGIVRPEALRQGLARALLVECLRQVPAHPAMLVATPAGQPLYASLGFQIVEQSIALSLAADWSHRPGRVDCRSMPVDDVPIAAALDAAA